MTPLPESIEANSLHVYAAWCRWWRRPRERAPTPEEEACRRLALQAALLRATQLEAVLADLRCPACRARVPNVGAEGHAATCDAVPAVRRWRLAANEVDHLRAALPEAERALVPDPFDAYPRHWSPPVEDALSQALAGRGTFRFRLSKALRHLLDHDSAPVAISTSDLGFLVHGGDGPASLETCLPLFLAVTESEPGIDSCLSGACPWCDRPLTTAALLPHLVECPRHPCLEPSAVLEDWAATRCAGSRHPVVGVLEQLHPRRTALRHLLAACDDFEDAFGWDGEHGYVRAADERSFDLARAPLAALGATPLVLPQALPGSLLESAVAATRAMHEGLAGLLRACRDFTNRFSDDGRRASLPEEAQEAAWREARRSARAGLAYASGWNLDPETQAPPLAFLRTFEGRVFWRTGDALLDGPELAAKLRHELGWRPEAYCT